MKLSYENDATKPLGASYMPGNVIREERTSAGMGAATPASWSLQEERGKLNRSSQDNVRVPSLKKAASMLFQAGVNHALQHFGVSPPTNADISPEKPKNVRIPDAGTGYATNGAQYGADTRK